MVITENQNLGPCLPHRTPYEPLVAASVYSAPSVLVFTGLPGSGKTSIARMVAKALGAVHFNADFVRATINKHLGFSKADRVKQAADLGTLARVVAEAGKIAVVDFICPIFDTRWEFNNALGAEHRDRAVWYEVSRDSRDRHYPDTEALYLSLAEEVSAGNSFVKYTYFKSLTNKEEPVHELANMALEYYREVVRSSDLTNL